MNVTQTGYESLSADQLRTAIAETRVKPRGKRGNPPMLLRERNRRTRAARKGGQPCLPQP